MALRPSQARAISRVISALCSFSLLAAGGCRKKPDATGNPSASASASAAGQAPKTLTPEQAQQILARVGERSITLGDYAAALERMDTFERIRYQSPERRRLLLNEMIELALLAQEARRRGLDQQPETQERIRQMLRDELLRDVRRGAPGPGDVSEADVRKYYEQHKADFNEPERRRVAHLVVPSAAEAQQLIAKAAGASNAEWGKLVSQNSLDKGIKALGPAPLELAGDLGIVGPPGHPRGGNPRVPEALRAAVFKIEKVGGVLAEPVAEGGRYHVVRLTSRTDARERSFEEAERSIRVSLVQEQIKERELKLEAELKTKYPVTIDEAALAKVRAPKAAASAAPAPL